MRFLLILLVACSPPAREAKPDYVPVRHEVAVDAAPKQQCEPFDPKNPACQDDPRMCLHPDQANPNCPSPTMIGRIIAYKATDSDGLITIGIGSDQGISARWKATLLRGESNEPLPNGNVTIVRINPRVTVGTIRLRDDVVRANSRVIFHAP